MPATRFTVFHTGVPAEWTCTLTTGIAQARRAFAELHSVPVTEVQWRWTFDS